MKHKDILLLVNVTATDDVYPTIIHYAKEHGWRLTIEDRLAPPEGWRGDGAIVEAMDIPIIARYLRSLRHKGISVVNLTDSRIARCIPSCIIDTGLVSRLASEHFCERGFTHAAFFSMEWVYGRKMQFAGFAKAWGKAYVSKWIWPEATKARNINNHAAMVKWIKGVIAATPKPIAVFCVNSYNAVTLLNICLDMGLSVPEEIAILSAQYDPAFCDCQTVPISGVEIDSRQHAMEAAAMLDGIIERRSDILNHILIKPKGIKIQQSTNVLASENPMMRHAFRFIRENLSHPFGAAEVAAYLGIPRIRLDRLFASELKRSVGSEILRQRISNVKRMLAESDAKIDSIAAETGFCHASYLIKAFKKAVGVTPHRFRSGLT